MDSVLTGTVDVERTYGALLLGAFMACGLSGIVAIQCVIYFKLYPEDHYATKSMVLTSWLLDIIHTSFVFASIWDYFIKYHSIDSRIDHIPWMVAFSVVVTAIQTFFVQCFFSHKILKSSRDNWYITTPIVVLALFRLLAACVSTIEMIRLQRFSAFTEKYPGWVFTTGLSLSAGVDVIITAFLCYFLQEIRSRIGRESTIMIKVVNALTLYTLENGALTCFTALASLICWLTMPYNLIFLGLHFIIGKLYANSFLASLNTRKELHEIQMRMGSGKHLTASQTRTGQGTAFQIEITSSEQSVSEQGRDALVETLSTSRRKSKEPTIIQFRAGSPTRWNMLNVLNPAKS